MGPLMITLGVDRYGRPVTYDLATASHMLVAGETRSGKSVLLYGTLAQAAALPVTVMGSDPSGVLLAPFEGEGVALGLDDPEAHVAALEHVDRIFRERLDLLQQTGRDVIDVTDPATPLVLVVLEEYVGLTQSLAAADAAASPRGKSAARLKSLVLGLVTQALKCGIRIVFSVQRADAEFLGGAARSNIATRVLLRSDAEACRMVLPSLSADGVDWVGRCAPGCGFLSAPGMAEPLKFRGFDYPYADYLARVRWLRD